MPLASKAGTLCAITVPSSGGETELADMRAAYDALVDDTTCRIITTSVNTLLTSKRLRLQVAR